ncbi:TPA: hypothetical protein U1B91_001630 [Streptococcus suis]|uniref:hypothetical protein n=1 Tax=Streptococcus suis TaxID=1307 RepID=UPI000CF55AE3|nr:hypothetical protein [Streptococcus suis]MBM7315639.1 hypothetical protein [Streptococcus suis]HEM3588349.1 hypothetical protein [Streptococcus suis]
MRKRIGNKVRKKLYHRSRKFNEHSKFGFSWKDILKSLILPIIVSLMSYFGFSKIDEITSDTNYNIVVNDVSNWESGDKVYTIYNSGDRPANNVIIELQSFMVLKDNDNWFSDKTYCFPVHAFDEKFKRNGSTEDLIGYVEMPNVENPFVDYDGTLHYLQLFEWFIPYTGDDPGLYDYIDFVVFTVISENGADPEQLYQDESMFDNIKVFASTDKKSEQIDSKKFFEKYYDHGVDMSEMTQDPLVFWGNTNFSDETVDEFLSIVEKDLNQ